MSVTSFHTMSLPQPAAHSSASSDCGMTLLDYFAGIALQGIIASTHNCSPEACAQMAYQYGDAMMGAREAWAAAQAQQNLERDPLLAHEAERTRFTT